MFKTTYRQKVEIAHAIFERGLRQLSIFLYEEYYIFFALLFYRAGHYLQVKQHTLVNRNGREKAIRITPNTAFAIQFAVEGRGPRTSKTIANVPEYTRS